MESDVRKEPSLNQLFAKLGHILEEIRVRALQSILSKLEYGVICNSDLVHERHLHVRLLEWFNFASCPFQDRVLGLILRLSEHSSASQIYLEVGAVEFLSQLRPNLDIGLHRIVDSILDNLFHLPMVDDGIPSTECVYNPQVMSSLSGRAGESTSFADSRNPVVSSDSFVSNSINKYTTAHIDSSTGGYFTTENVDSRLVLPPVVAAICMKFCTFPWISLTPTDRHVLASTDESVRSKDVSTIISVCEFLTDVVLHDFPADVFLQRPSIIKNLLSLLSATNCDKILLAVLRVLRELTSNLTSRINFLQDPCFYASKQDFAIMPTLGNMSRSTASDGFDASDEVDQAAVIGQARHRGDGQDVDTSSSSSSQSFSQSIDASIAGDLIEEVGLDEVYSLQFMQWTVPQFCLELLNKVVPCLGGAVDDRLGSHGLELIHQAVALIRESVSADLLWNDRSYAARELIDKFHDVLENLTNVLFSHHHSNLSSLMPDSDQERHRIMFIGISVFTVELLKSLVPLEMVAVAIPGEFEATLAAIGLDWLFGDAYPQCAAVVLDYMRSFHGDSIVAYGNLNGTCVSLISTCKFLSKFAELNDDVVPLLLQLAMESMPSLYYHCCLDFVDACVTLCSYICKKTSPSPNAVRDSRRVLLAVLSHSVDSVRLRAHERVLSIIETALGIDNVVEPTSASTLSAIFVVDSKILYQLSVFSLMDKNPQVKEKGESILLYLFQSYLLIPSTRWQQVLDALLPILPAVQSCASMDSPLGKSIIGMLETDLRVDTGVLPLLERLRGSLRIMLHRDQRVRAAGAERCLKFVAQQKSSVRKLPSLSDIDTRNMSDLFIVKNVVPLSDNTSNSTFQSTDVKKVFDIFVDDNVELAVRKSACDQLAVILSDVCLQSAFIQFGGLNAVLNTLKSAVEIPVDLPVSRNPLSNLLPGVVHILRRIVEKDAAVRHRLMQETELYYSVLRSVFIHHRDNEMRNNAAQLLALLLFDELSALREWDIADETEELFSLPACVVNRYVLPFVIPVHHKESPWRMVTTPLDDSSWQTLRVVWNIAWHDGIEPTIVSDNRTSDSFSKALVLTHIDRILCSTTHVPHALKQSTNVIINATCHQDVSRGLLRLRFLLSAGGPCNNVKHLDGIKWKEAVTRFVLVAPSTSADEQLLTDVVQFLSLVVMQSDPGADIQVFNWITDVVLNTKGAMYQLLTRPAAIAEKDTSDAAQTAHRQFTRSVLKLIRLVVARYPYHLVGKETRGPRRNESRCVHGDLAHSVLAKINRVDSIQSYNLPSLEMTLLALLHITAREGWSVNCSCADSLGLCLEMMQTLLEVVSAFHAGRGGISMSYMGRGITRSAAVCLRHLAHEMATHLQSQEWPRNWLFSKHANNGGSVGESGLHWLFPLWSYRDIEVHIAGISIATALTSTEAGRITMATECHNVPGGIWGAALNLLLDASECSMARQQAALLLVNLTSQTLPREINAESTAAAWQGPVVRNEETGVSLFGLEALLVLLRHLQFYDKIKTILSSIFVQPAVRPINNLASRYNTSVTSTNVSSQSTALTTSYSSPQVATGILVDVNTSSQLPDDDHHQTRLLGDVATETTRERHITGEGHTENDNRTLALRASNRLLSGFSQSSSSGDNQVVQITGEVVNSIVTPCFVSSVCCLLSNIISLSPDETAPSLRVHGVFSQLTDLLDFRLLRMYLSDLETTEYHAQFLLTFTDLVSMHRDVVDLVTACTVCDIQLRNDLLANSAAMKQILLLLTVVYRDDLDAMSECSSLWKSCLTLLCSLLSTAGQDAYAALCPVLSKHWQVVSGCLIDIVRDKNCIETELWMMTLNFIGSFFSEECKMKNRAGSGDENIVFLAAELDKSPTSADDTEPVTGGWSLCCALVGAVDAVLTKPSEQFFVAKAAVINAVKTLLSVSSSAKLAALEVGLFETLCDHVRHLHNQLNLEALDLVKSSSASKKRSSSTVSELMITFDALRNFLYHSEEVKIHASRSPLAGLIHCLWCWCQTDNALMSSTLALLCVYTAHCCAACITLAFTAPSALTVIDKETSLSSVKHSSNSLVHCLIRLIQKESSTASVQSSVLRLAFNLVSILTLSAECRGILWKSNFLHEFSALSPQKNKKSKSAGQVDSLWLALLVNLSFSTEGQSMILKIEDSLSLLIHFCSFESHESTALLVLRNLCFHSANKPKLLANDKLVPVLMRNVESGSSFTQSVACSAIFALVYNNQKAKGLLKNAATVCKLRDAYNRCSNNVECARMIQDILVLLKN